MKLFAVLSLSLIGCICSGSAFSQAPTKQRELFVGNVVGCNAGVITTNKNHLNCGPQDSNTNPVGFSVTEGSPASARGVELFVGTSPGINEGFVSTERDYRGGGTNPIGYSTSAQFNGTKLYVGTVDNCNRGVVSNNARHLGCETREIGFTHP
jgi:hypothetical protein